MITVAVPFVVCLVGLLLAHVVNPQGRYYHLGLIAFGVGLFVTLLELHGPLVGVTR